MNFLQLFNKFVVLLKFSIGKACHAQLFIWSGGICIFLLPCAYPSRLFFKFYCTIDYLFAIWPSTCRWFCQGCCSCLRKPNMAHKGIWSLVPRVYYICATQWYTNKQNGFCCHLYARTMNYNYGILLELKW